jgi:hypothetical protein
MRSLPFTHANLPYPLFFKEGYDYWNPFFVSPWQRGDNSGDSGCPLQPGADPSEVLWRIREHDDRETLTSFATVVNFKLRSLLL